MASYPSVKDDTVLYEPKSIYSDQNIKLSMLDGSQLEIWGQAYLNGVPIDSSTGFDVRTYGAKGDGVTDDTLALQNAINAAILVCGTVSIPPGNYKFSTLSISGPVTIRGSGSKSNAQPKFGEIGFNPPWIAGTVLRSTATTGKAIYSSAPVLSITLSDFALIGPGTGTSIGLALGHTDYGICLVRTRIERLIVGNFATGVYLGLENSQVDSLFVQGCLTGIQTGNAHNGNTHNATNIESCTNFALQLTTLTDTNIWNGGVIQGNCFGGGTVVAIDNASQNIFIGFYFENTGATTTVHIGHNSGAGDSNVIQACHFGIGSSDKLRIDTQGNTIIGCTISTPIILDGFANTLIGTFVGGITDMVGIGDNIILSYTAIGCLGNQDIRMKLGKKLYLASGVNHYVAYNSTSGHTELNGGNVDLSINTVAQLRLNPTGMGFNAATPIAKPTVSGAKGGNAALASLLTALASYGLITDSSTA